MIVPAADSPGQGTLPIFDSVESDWFRTGGRGMVRDNEPRPWTSPDDEGWRAAAAIATPSVGGMTAAGLPQRVPRANLVPGSAGDQLTGQRQWPNRHRSRSTG